ncbi:MAG: hypothetical protein C4335_08365 [Armatimonadota bacterium]
MRKDVLRLFTGALLFVAIVNQAFADALLRAWVTSGNQMPFRLMLHVPRDGFPAKTIQTVRFTVQNPLPRRTLYLQVAASYTTDTGEPVTTQSGPLVLEVDQTARDCRLYFYIINGYALEDTLILEGYDYNLPYNASYVLVPIDAIPAGTTLKGQVNIFAR